MAHGLGETLPLWSVLPFAGLLLAIALAPLAAPHWWERRYGAVSVGLGLPVALYFLAADRHVLFHTLHEYVSFITLLATLFVITGGILIRGTFPPTPAVNALFLAIGAVLANFIGTTGASMLLVRPLLRANAGRLHQSHVFVFFIFLVSNIGGALTPLGDPPLFLGYLEGVPFFWTLRLWPPWLCTVAAVLVVFYLVDRRYCSQEPVSAAAAVRFSVSGTSNFALLTGVIGAVFVASPWREALMIGLAALSYQSTRADIHAENGFTFRPIIEVAVLFVGIFMTMMPALQILEARGSYLGLHAPWQYFWVTGTLSSFLDNAPTYLTFLSSARGVGLPAEVAGVPHQHLAAISLGAVFMGANSYIGNGPNFMVKAIVEQHGVRMPSFFGYMAYSGLVLLPVFGLVTVLFFR